MDDGALATGAAAFSSLATGGGATASGSAFAAGGGGAFAFSGFFFGGSAGAAAPSFGADAPQPIARASVVARKDALGLHVHSTRGVFVVGYCDENYSPDRKIPDRFDRSTARKKRVGTYTFCARARERRPLRTPTERAARAATATTTTTTTTIPLSPKKPKKMTRPPVYFSV